MTNDTLSTTMKHLRRAIGDNSCDIIVSVKRIGYVLSVDPADKHIAARVRQNYAGYISSIVASKSM